MILLLLHWGSYFLVTCERALCFSLTDHLPLLIELLFHLSVSIFQSCVVFLQFLICGLKVLVWVVFLQSLIFGLKYLDLLLTLLFFNIFKLGGFQDLIDKREIVVFEVIFLIGVTIIDIFVRLVLGAVWCHRVYLSINILVGASLFHFTVSSFVIVWAIVI